MNQSYIKIHSNYCIEMCEVKIANIETEIENEVEAFIQTKIKPERRVWFFFKQKAVTRDDAIKSLDEEHHDLFGHITVRNMILSHLHSELYKAKLLMEMAQCGKMRGDNFIRLVKSDYIFLKKGY